MGVHRTCGEPEKIKTITHPKTFTALSCDQDGLRQVHGGTRPEPFNFTPMGVNSISFGSPHVGPIWALSTCGEPDEIKKNTHPKNTTAPCREQAKPNLHRLSTELSPYRTVRVAYFDCNQTQTQTRKDLGPRRSGTMNRGVLSGAVPLVSSACLTYTHRVCHRGCYRGPAHVGVCIVRADEQPKSNDEIELPAAH